MLFVRFGMYVSGWLARWRLLAGERACVSTHLEQNIYIRAHISFRVQESTRRVTLELRMCYLICR